MNEIILPGVRERLKPLRKEKGITQKQMAELLDCTEQHYQRMEYGKVNLPATTVIFLADYFGVTADYLLGRE
jgi:transcriptional regulator with XRE-family HTH domain